MAARRPTALQQKAKAKAKAKTTKKKPSSMKSTSSSSSSSMKPSPNAAPAAQTRRTSSRKIWLGEQETEYSCGPASLKYALCVFGFSPREEELRKLAHTTWEGTHTTKLLSAARRFGLSARIKVFFHDEFDAAWGWLIGELQAGRVVILDVEGYAHYVVAVQELEGHVVIIDPEGATMNGSDYADIVLATPKKLRPWWLSGDEEGEPEAFRGISLEPGGVTGPRIPQAERPRLRFSAAAIRRFHQGRPWILDEYLIDVVDIANPPPGPGAPSAGAVVDAGVDAGVAAGIVAGIVGGTPPWPPGDAKPLGDVLRAMEDVATRVTFWHEARPAEMQMAWAHLEDLAVAADAMQLTIPDSEAARRRVAVDVAALLMAMLWAPD